MSHPVWLGVASCCWPACLRLAKRGRSWLTPPPLARTSITVSNGQSRAAWRAPLGDWKLVKAAALSPDNPKAFALAEGKGVLVNGDKGRTGNLFSKHEHGDVMAAIEYMVPEGSNSGIYFQGRYEIQILDSHGKTGLTHGDNGGIYERWADGKGFEGTAPAINASKPAGRVAEVHRYLPRAAF